MKVKLKVKLCAAQFKNRFKTAQDKVKQLAKMFFLFEEQKRGMTFLPTPHRYLP